MLPGFVRSAGLVPHLCLTWVGRTSLLVVKSKNLWSAVGFSTTTLSFHLLPISLLLPRVQLVPPFSSTLSLFPLPELNHSSCPFLFLCVICGIIFLYLLLCCPVLVCSNYLFYVCITACLNLLRFITVIYFCPLYHLLLYSVFLTHSPYILFFSPVLYLLVGHLVFSIWLLFWSFLALCLNLLKKKKKKVADAFGHENAFSAWGDTVSSYRDCMHVWETWMAFDEVTPVSTMLFSISTRSTVQLHLLECFVVHYTSSSSACWGSEWAEKGSACGWHVLHLLKASNNRAYKESCLPIKSKTLFIPAPIICLLLCTDFNKILNLIVQTFILYSNCTSNLNYCLCTMLVTENWHFKIKLQINFEEKVAAEVKFDLLQNIFSYLPWNSQTVNIIKTIGFINRLSKTLLQRSKVKLMFLLCIMIQMTYEQYRWEELRTLSAIWKKRLPQRSKVNLRWPYSSKWSLCNSAQNLLTIVWDYIMIYIVCLDTHSLSIKCNPEYVQQN